jgi:predicted ribosomally synthesized peptide with SipW-like signal peptide
MKQRKLLIAIISVVLVALISIGATLAYLFATDAEDNEVTIGDVSIELLEYQRDENGNLVEFVDDKLLLPAVTYDYGQTATVSKEVDENNIRATVWKSDSNPYAEDKMVFVKNTGTLTNAYVRLCFAFEAGNYASFEQFQNKIHLNINETDWTWTWDEKLAEVKGMKCFIAWATYKKAIAPDEITTFGMSQIALDGEATNADSYSFGDKYDVLVLAQGIQADGMGTATAALDNGFGTDVPFVGFRYVTFANLKTALHNLNAVANNTITSKVNSVTFGLFRDHYEKVLGYDGVATKNVDDQEAFAAYTYYVPTSDDKYDIYVLTDAGVIYTPNISKELFANMSSLAKVDTANLDVSKTTDMNSMFSNCSALAEIDVSNWDVSNVTTMYYMFDRCSSLAELAVSEWNVQKVGSMGYTFSGCSALTSDKFDVSKWNVRAVKSFGGTFNGCASLTTLDLSKWQTGSATEMWEMFQGCKLLTTLKISNWNVSNVTVMRHMFNGCDALQIIDISGWDTASLTSTQNMFSFCDILTTIYVGAGWNVASVTESTQMFTESKKLVGGEGTTYNASKVNKEYARIDNQPEAPGYFTQGTAPTTP